MAHGWHHGLKLRGAAISHGLSTILRSSDNRFSPFRCMLGLLHGDKERERESQPTETKLTLSAVFFARWPCIHTEHASNECSNLATRLCKLIVTKIRRIITLCFICDKRVREDIGLCTKRELFVYGPVVQIPQTAVQWHTGSIWVANAIARRLHRRAFEHKRRIKEKTIENIVVQTNNNNKNTHNTLNYRLAGIIRSIQVFFFFLFGLSQTVMLSISNQL